MAVVPEANDKLLVVNVMAPVVIALLVGFLPTMTVPPLFNRAVVLPMPVRLMAPLLV